jgi:hypothetical protein
MPSLLAIPLLLFVTGTAPTLELPPGPPADFMASKPSPAEPRPELAALPAWDSGAWNTEAPWTRWATALETPDEPASRLELLGVARALGRSTAAWQHFTKLPRVWAEGLLTELLLAPHTDTEGRLVLAPLLPPAPVFDRATWTGLPPLRRYTAHGLQLGETRIALAVEVAPEGVEVRLHWEAGPPLEVAVQIPTPDDWRARLVYVDWDSHDLAPEGYAVRLAPLADDEDPEHVLWARCEAERRTWPRLDAAGFHASAETPLILASTADDSELPRLRQAASFLTRILGLGARLDVSPLPTAPGGSPRVPLRIDLGPGPQRDLKLRDVVAQAEEVALARRIVETQKPR